jgi:hypothetical protein
MRTISVVDRLLVLARAVRHPDGRLALEPPRGGFVISSLELDDAMRLLGGPRRAWMLVGVALVAGGVLLGAASLVLLAIG